MLTAITIVPALSRLLLKSAGYPKQMALGVAIALATLMGTMSHFLWGDDLAAHFGIDHRTVTLLAALIGFILGWQLLRERIRPIEQIPTSRLVHWIYAARLRQALDHKVIALSFPAVLLVLGAGAYIGLPTVMKPVERAARYVGTDLNVLPGYVTRSMFSPGCKAMIGLPWTKGVGFTCRRCIPRLAFHKRCKFCKRKTALIGQIP